MTAKTRLTAERQQAQDQLREIFPPGSTAHTILRHVSRSGMSRSISVVDQHSNDVTWLVVRALGEKLDRHDGIRVGGCGMDMGFHLVYSLSRTLYPDGFECTCSDRFGDSCPSNDHFNGDRDYTPHQHEDGGYAIRQRWL